MSSEREYTLHLADLALAEARIAPELQTYFPPSSVAKIVDFVVALVVAILGESISDFESAGPELWTELSSAKGADLDKSSRQLVECFVAAIMRDEGGVLKIVHQQSDHEVRGWIDLDADLQRSLLITYGELTRYVASHLVTNETFRHAMEITVSEI